MQARQAVNIGVTNLAILILALACGCDEPTGQAPSAAYPPSGAAGPNDGDLSTTAYVSNFFGFELTFADEETLDDISVANWKTWPSHWRATTASDLSRPHVELLPPSFTPMAFIRHHKPTGIMSITASSHDPRPDGSRPSARQLLAEQADRLPAGCAVDGGVRDVTLGGRACARLDVNCDDGLLATYVFFLERKHVVQFVITSSEADGIAAADVVLDTLTSH